MMTEPRIHSGFRLTTKKRQREHFPAAPFNWQDDTVGALRPALPPHSSLGYLVFALARIFSKRASIKASPSLLPSWKEPNHLSKGMRPSP